MTRFATRAATYALLALILLAAAVVANFDSAEAGAAPDETDQEITAT